MSSLQIRGITTTKTRVVNCDLVGNATLSRSSGTSASASSGMGGWQVVDRSRQKAATEWLDYFPWVLTMQCILDGGPGMTPASVEPACLALESFEVPVPGKTPPLPPLLMVSGPVPHTDLVWVCSRLEFTGGDGGAIRNTAGTRTQQSFSIELTEYSPSTALTSATLSPAQRAQLNSGSAAGLVTITAGKGYVVKAGDTLQSIAAKQLGTVTLWQQIAILNGLSPSAVLVPGMHLTLPVV